ncbi:MAG: hypothetical protein H0T78_11950 [Longispora sp.]|nr:hypothetical protein [Longispora sp. (in: high G+C Gram-positive bacteria)]
MDGGELLHINGGTTVITDGKVGKISQGRVIVNGGEIAAINGGRVTFHDGIANEVNGGTIYALGGKLCHVTQGSIQVNGAEITNLIGGKIRILDGCQVIGADKIARAYNKDTSLCLGHAVDIAVKGCQAYTSGQFPNSATLMITNEAGMGFKYCDSPEGIWLYPDNDEDSFYEDSEQ